MSGRRFLLDTNAIIQLFKGNAELSVLLSGADFVAASVISEMEYLSFSGLSEHDANLFREFRANIDIYGVPSDNRDFTQMVVEARTLFRMKLPDAIIAATARDNGLTILTADDHFKSLQDPWNVQFFIPA